MQQVLNDQAYMAEAIRHAYKGLYTVRINPRVGCVIVKQNRIVASGFHEYYGHNHAEVVALDSAKDDVSGATAYVTLEPCSHHGNTPPCVEALVRAKLSRVVIATLDPNPLVNGKGIRYLNAHKITTTKSILQNEALELNKGFIKRITTNLPYVTIKSAISMDGKTALASGESKWITSAAAREDVQKLRARSCAILTGIGTVISDDPSLNVRLSEKELGITAQFEQPLRVVVDSHLRIPIDAKLLNLPGKVIVYTCSTDKEKIAALKNVNTEVVIVSFEKKHVDLTELMSDLAKKGVNEILVEAGPTLVGSLLEQNLADELTIYIAPHLLGDASKGLANLPSIITMQERINLKLLETNIIDTDIKIRAKPITN